MPLDEPFSLAIRRHVADALAPTLQLLTRVERLLGDDVSSASRVRARPRLSEPSAPNSRPAPDRRPRPPAPTSIAGTQEPSRGEAVTVHDADGGTWRGSIVRKTLEGSFVVERDVDLVRVLVPVDRLQR